MYQYTLDQQENRWPVKRKVITEQNRAIKTIIFDVGRGDRYVSLTARVRDFAYDIYRSMMLFRAEKEGLTKISIS